MRDAIDLFEYAEHGHHWTAAFEGLFGRLHEALRWAGAAFTASGLHRLG